MSTFMGLAWMDLVPGGDGEAALAAFRTEAAALPEGPADLPFLVEELEAVELSGGGYRVATLAGGYYDQLADLVVRLAAVTGLISHAFIALDHDEYGAEHMVIDVHDGAIRRVYHYFAYPRREDGSYYVEDGLGLLREIPAVEEPRESGDPGVLVDGPMSRAIIAARYGISMEDVDRAANADMFAHEKSGRIGGPSSAWCDALGLAWPGGGW